ncbi:uncharacterized protein [Palaemon carinicauda]|uniref:uncharacterized protein n=1 Tax=Palaemon carinicauda TaxID=392227 RepID=UPI0035B65A30
MVRMQQPKELMILSETRTPVWRSPGMEVTNKATTRFISNKPCVQVAEMHNSSTNFKLDCTRHKNSWKTQICITEDYGDDELRNFDIKFQDRDVEDIQRRWFGHVQRMEQDRWPKIVVHGQVAGNRSRGRPRDTWVKTFKKANRGETIQQLEQMALDKSLWREWRYQMQDPTR